MNTLPSDLLVNRHMHFGDVALCLDAFDDIATC
jgi:hypothetical protein